MHLNRPYNKESGFGKLYLLIQTIELWLCCRHRAMSLTWLCAYYCLCLNGTAASGTDDEFHDDWHQRSFRTLPSCQRGK